MISLVIILILSLLLNYHYFSKTNRLKSIEQNILTFEILKNYENLIILFNIFLEKTFSIVYKDNIFVYSSSGLRLSDEEVEILSKTFAKTFLLMIGSNLERLFLILFGTEEVLYRNIIYYFNQRIEEDPIREIVLNENTEKNQNQENLGAS